MIAAEVLASLAQIAEWDDPAQRFDATAALARQLGLDGADEMTVRVFQRDAKTRDLLNLSDSRAFIREGRQLAAASGNGGSSHEAPAAPALPPHHVKVSHGPWYYAEGAEGVEGAEGGPCHSCRASGYGRGLHGDRGMYAELPHCHARIIRRDGSGARIGTSYLLSATPDGPRIVVSNAQLADGSAWPALGLVLADDPRVRQAAGWAVRDVAEQAPEREAVPRRNGDGRIAIPPRECLPSGYLAVADVPPAEALATWRQLAELAALSPAIADILGAAVFAPFVAALRMPPHWLDASGGSDRGKSTTLRLAAALWGDPLNEGGTFRVWNYAPIGLLRALGELGILPMFVDESGMSGFSRDQWGQCIYRTTGGTSRTGAEYRGDGVKSTLPWSSILFVTGNARVIDGLNAGKYAGIPKRVIESAGPFTLDADHAEAIDALVPQCFGHPGREVLTRYAIADAAERLAAAAELVGLPSGGNPRTWARELHCHVAGAIMLDEIFGTGTLLRDAAARFAADYLDTHTAEPKGDGDQLAEALAESMTREPVRWPTRSEYRAARGPRPATEFDAAQAARLPQIGLDGRNLAGVRDDAGAWAAVFPSVLAELADRLGIDQDRALRELHTREVLDVAEGLRRRGEWQSFIRLMPRPAPPDRMYRFLLPLIGDDDQADDAAAPEPGSAAPAESEPEAVVPENVSQLPTRVFKGQIPDTPDTPQVKGGFPPDTAPDTNPIPHPIPTAEGLCTGCGGPLAPALAAFGETTHACCDPRGGVPEPEPADQPELPLTEPAEPAPAAVPSPRPTASASAAGRGPAFLVWDGGELAHAPEGELVPVPRGSLAACRDVGALAALALDLRTRRLYVTRAAREALGLPAGLPDVERPGQGVPHSFADADRAVWDVWPGNPVGLGAWMSVYTLPRSGEGAAIVLAEWLDGPTLDGPAFGEMEPAELAHALTLIWKSTTFTGNGGRYGGVHFHHSPQATFRRLVETRMRRSERGIPGSPELPPLFGQSPRARGAVLMIPGGHMAPAQEVPAGWVLAELDVRSCYAASARGTDFPVGGWHKLRPPQLDKKTPGIHLCSVPADAAAIHPALMPWFPAPKRGQREVRAWLDSLAAIWLAEHGVPLRTDISYVWPEADGRRVFDSPIREVLAARDQLAALDGAPAWLARDVITAGYQRFFGGWLGSDAWERAPGQEWTDNRAWWLRIRTQAEVRKQRNLVPMLAAGALALGQAKVDTVWIAVPSLDALDGLPGTGGRPALGDGPGKFRREAHAIITPELAAQLGDKRAPDHVRRAAIVAALDSGKGNQA